MGILIPFMDTNLLIQSISMIWVRVSVNDLFYDSLTICSRSVVCLFLQLGMNVRKCKATPPPDQ